MSVTVQSIVDQCAWDLCEDTNGGPGFITGIISQQTVLDHIGVVLMDFLRQTGLIWSVFTQQLIASQSQYQTPDQMPEVFYVFQNAQIVNKIHSSSSYLQGQWERKPGQIKAYHEDNLPINTVEVVPAPNWNGTVFTPTVGPPPPFGTFGDFQAGSRNLTFVGSSLASKETWGIGDTLDTIPDSLTPYLCFGVLERIFSADGETKDLQKAEYCHTRYSEGISLGRGVILQLMEEAEHEGSM